MQATAVQGTAVQAAAIGDEPPPRKLRDILDREFLPARLLKKNTSWRYRHALTHLTEALAYQPTTADLKPHVIDWLAKRLQLLGYSPESERDVIGRLRTLAAWCRRNRPWIQP